MLGDWIRRWRVCLYFEMNFVCRREETKQGRDGGMRQETSLIVADLLANHRDVYIFLKKPTGVNSFKFWFQMFH